MGILAEMENAVIQTFRGGNWIPLPERSCLIAASAVHQQFPFHATETCRGPVKSELLTAAPSWRWRLYR